MMKKVPVFSHRLIFAAAATCFSQWLIAGVPGAVPGVPGTVPGVSVPGAIPAGVPGMAVPGGVPGEVPGMVTPGGVPGGGGQQVQGLQNLNPQVKRVPIWDPARGPMPPMMAIQLLTGNGFTARSYYNGVPDLSSREASQVRTRDVIKRKLQTIKLPPMGQDGKGFDGMNMSAVLNLLEAEIKKFDPTGSGISLVINPYIDPGGAAISPTPVPGGGADGPAGPGGGMTIDPVTGLPIGGGAGPVGGPPDIDPITGLPANTGAPGAAPGLPGGDALGGVPGMLGGVPGIGMPGIGGMPGAGGGAAPSTAMQGAFDPEQVKVMNLGRGLPAMTAKQVLDVVAMSFDHPIQYVVMDHGVMFFQQNPQFANTVTRTFTLNLNTRSLAQLGIQTPQLGGGGGQGQGGGQGGGGQGPGGQGPGGQGPDGGYPGGDGGGDGGGEMMQMQKIRPFNSMGGYYSPQRFNSFSARPTPNPNFRR